MAAATAGTFSLTTSAQDVWTKAVRPGVSFIVFNKSDSSGLALIRVDGLHASGEYLPIPPGGAARFSVQTAGFVSAKSDSTATIYCGLTG